MANILIVDDAIENLKMVLEHSLEEHELSYAKSGSEAMAILETSPGIDLVLLDVKMPPEFAPVEEGEGIEVLRRIKQLSPSLPVIMLTVYHDIDTAVEATKEGAFHYLTKPPDLDKLHDAIERALENRNLKEEVGHLRRTVDTLTQLRGKGRAARGKRDRFGKLIGRSHAMQRLFDEIEQVAGVDVSVLLLGETGVGKDLAAQEIHKRSLCSKGPFLAVNCSAIHENLLESQMFGHKRGSFTGATQDHTGDFELANSGTIFLDEIGDMPLALQAKLLRVLQDGLVRPLGSTKSIKTNVRVLSATNKDLSSLRASGEFRDDLFYRLNVVPITVPPLRERKGDIPLLAEHFLSTFSQEFGKEISGFSGEALAKLEAHNWPGNVRELENILKRAIVKCRGNTIDAADIEPGEHVSPPGSHDIWDDIMSGKESIDDLTKFRNLYGEHTLKEVFTRALQEKNDIRAAGRLIGYLGSDDDKTRYDNLRKWISRLGISTREIRRG